MAAYRGLKMGTASQYKLDFGYKFGLGKKIYRFATIVDNSTYGLKNAIYSKYIADGRRDDFWAYAKPEDMDVNSIEQYCGTFADEAVKPALVEQLQKFLANKEMPDILDNSFYQYHHALKSFCRGVIRAIVKKTPEYTSMISEYESWLKKRPVIVQMFKDYVAEENKKCNDPNTWRYRSTGWSDSLELENFVEITQKREFRRILENTRPTKFPAGTVVRLKNSFLHSRSKDPFRYEYDPEVRKAERIGTVLKRSGTNHNYGEGSREIRVLWFATGKESYVMERCLQIADVDSITPAAANG